MSESESPLGRAVTAVTHLDIFIETVLQGFGWAMSATRINEILKDSPLVQKNARHWEHRKLRAEQAEAFAHEQASRGFPYLWYLASIRLWTILEVAVNDLAVYIIQSIDLIPHDSVLHALEGPLVAFTQASPAERASLLAEQLKEKCRTRFKPGVGRYEALLNPIGLGGPVIPEVRRILLELSEVRHLVVHCNGIVDERFTDSCPWFNATIGEQLRLLESHYRTYTCAVDWYVLELNRRLNSHLRVESDPAELETQTSIQKTLYEALQAREQLSNQESSVSDAAGGTKGL